MKPVRPHADQSLPAGTSDTVRGGLRATRSIPSAAGYRDGAGPRTASSTATPPPTEHPTPTSDRRPFRSVRPAPRAHPAFIPLCFPRGEPRDRSVSRSLPCEVVRAIFERQSNHPPLARTRTVRTADVIKTARFPRTLAPRSVPTPPRGTRGRSGPRPKSNRYGTRSSHRHGATPGRPSEGLSDEQAGAVVERVREQANTPDQRGSATTVPWSKTSAVDHTPTCSGRLLS